jgi:hypothetical protein
MCMVRSQKWIAGVVGLALGNAPSGDGDRTFGILPHLGAIARTFPYITPKSLLARLAHIAL